MAVEFNQTDFRFRNDDGSHTAATWKAAANTNISVNVAGGNVQLRVRLAAREDGTTSATFAANLFMSKNGGAYAQVGSASANVKAVDSANLTDNSTTTQQISSATYVSGRVDDVDGTTTATASIAQNSGTEFEFMIELISADLDHNDTLDFRLYRSAAALTTYTQTARITIVKQQSSPINQITETDMAQAVSRVKSRAAGQIAEADTAQAVSRVKIRAIAQSEETDIVLPVGRVKIRAIGQVVETESAFSVAGTKSRTISQAEETGLVQQIFRTKQLLIGQAVEIDLAQTLTRMHARQIGQASEIDLSQALSTRKIRSIGIATEIDTAQPLVSNDPIGVSTNIYETDSRVDYPTASRVTYSTDSRRSYDL
jgi:hypothetical protein